MRPRVTTALLLGVMLACAASALAQSPRLDAIWARSTNGAQITLDGILNEPAWAIADSVIVRYGVDNGIPGSGWQEEGGKFLKDSTYAVLKFVTVGNTLYMAATVRDSSVGGDVDFNRIDGFLIGIKDHSVTTRPAPVREYFYSWWFPLDTLHAHDPGRSPCFKGLWAPDSCAPRNPTQIANWDAVTVVHGQSNNDAVLDNGYTVEMKFALTPLGYDVTQSGGDVVEWNIDIKDADWNWPINFSRFGSNRSWWQSPWSADTWYDEGHIFARPDVTIASGPAPQIPPEVRVANAGAWPAPVIDGRLNEPVWSLAPHFDIRWGDDPLRASYPAVGPWRSGQWQPSVNDTVAANIVDPGDATVRWFFKDDTLYFGFDVRDQYVQYIPLYTRYDGIAVNLNDRGARWRDRNLEARWLTYLVGPTGTGLALDYLPYLRDTLFGARVACRLKGIGTPDSTTVDTVGFAPDSGYTMEMAVDLTKLGYPHGLGDRALFLGINLMDGDSFGPSGVKDDYGTHQWWFWHQQRECCPVWAYLDPNLYLTTDVPGPSVGEPYVLLGNYPNPFRSITFIGYSLAAASDVTIEVYDVQGRLVARRPMGLQSAGKQHVTFTNPGLRTGIYLYRLRAADPLSGKQRAGLSGKMMVLK